MLKNLSMNEECYTATVETKYFLCALTQSEDWLVILLFVLLSVLFCSVLFCAVLFYKILCNLLIICESISMVNIFFFLSVRVFLKKFF